MRALSRELLSGAAVSVLDQAILSAVNFAIGLAFIQFSSKLDYGIYVQLFGLLMLSQSLQTAVVNGPMVAMAPKRRARGYRAVAAMLFRLQTVVSILLATVAFIGVEIAALGLAIPALESSVAWVFALAILGQWLREFAREFYFLQLNPHAAFLVDLCYVVPLTGLLAVAALTGRFDTTWVLGSMAFANALAGLVGLWRCGLRPLAAHGRWRQPVWESWQLSRWTLPGVVLSWFANFSFVFVVAGVLGAVAAAEVSAARLLLMPAGLCNTAWLAVIIPRVSRWTGQGELHLMNRIAAASIGGTWLVIVSYFAVLMLGYDLLETHVLGEDYAGLQPLAWAWAAYFLLLCARTAFTAWILGAGMFREALWYNLAGFVVGFPVTIALTMTQGAIGALFGLMVWELIHAVLTWRLGWPRWRRQFGRR